MKPASVANRPCSPFLGSLPSALLAGLAWLAVAGPASAGPAMIAHRAIYDLELDSEASDKVSDAEGRMVYDFSGSPCDGYTTRLRFVTRVSDEDGNTRLTDVATTTFEDDAGKRFDFATKSYVDGAISDDSTGSAERGDGKVRVTMAKPQAKHFDLASSFRFPNQHLKAIIDAAASGQHFLQANLFDGSDKAGNGYETSIVIGGLNSGVDDLGDEATAKLAGLGDVRHWPVTISYFSGTAAGEQSPTYELSFIVYENGITRRMRLDYGDFALTGKLVRLDLAPTKVRSKSCR
jgi:hypothetical protein